MDSSEIAWIVQEFSEALRPICEAIQEFIERVREMFARIAEIARVHLAGVVKRVRVAMIYNRLRTLRIPHMLAVIVAYLWVVKRWPPHTVLSG